VHRAATDILSPRYNFLVTNPATKEPPGATLGAIYRSWPIRLLISLRELIVLMAAYLTFANTPFKNAELEVRHRLLHVQPSIEGRRLIDSILPTLTVDSLVAPRVTALAADSQVWNIRLVNTSPKELTSVDMQFSGVVAYRGLGVSSNSTGIEKNKSSFSVVTNSDGISHLQGLERIPPDGIIDISIWGDFSPVYSLEIHSTAQSTRIREFQEVSGIGATIDQNREVFALLITFALLLLGLRRLKSDHLEETHDPPSAPA